jgi:hypothetical protein
MLDVFVGIDGTTESMRKAQYMPNPDDKNMSIIGKLYDASLAPKGFKEWYPGPDTPGLVLPSECVLKPLEYIMKIVTSDTAKRSGGVRLCIAGYSRGAYAAIRIVQALNRSAGRHKVHQLILLDTVKVTIQITEDEVAEVIGTVDASFDRKKNTNQYKVVGTKVPHAVKVSDGGDRYSRELEREVYEPDQRDRVTGSWNPVDEHGHFIVPKNALRVASFQRHPDVKSRDWTMGVSRVKPPGNGFDTFPPLFILTHSGMGGMPFRGDLPTKDVTRLNEWVNCAKLAKSVSKAAQGCGAFGALDHPTMRSTWPSDRWLNTKGIESQYRSYIRTFGSDNLTPGQDWKYLPDSRK